MTATFLWPSIARANDVRPDLSAWSDKARNSINEQTRRANAQMTHIRQTYGTFSQSFLLHNQPSQTLELLHATLLQNVCTRSSFPCKLVTLDGHQGHSNRNQTVEFRSV